MKIIITCYIVRKVKGDDSPLFNWHAMMTCGVGYRYSSTYT